MTRLSRDDYYMELALATSRRSTCLDKQVGCVLVSKTGIVLATGYNGAPRGFEHCSDLGYCKKDVTGNPSDCPSAHAEQNALLYAHPDQVHQCYVNLSPCINCIRMLLNTSCQEIVFLQEHRHPEARNMWCELHKVATWRQLPRRDYVSRLLYL